ncbi:MAG: acireductone dioxygenase [Pirellulaceae bacterium]|jgi:1,2-dihydroxy-3-keto-5-methylthiopentene dioxygenase|nr:acireductone dioxygenase [Pirellulaceae bacterium]HJN10082.1 acireductone dioxygenase [Pirellulaceae bacterium]
MASISIPDENRTITDPQEMSAFLTSFGVWYDKWDVDGRVGSEAPNEEILAAFAPEIERLKEKGGYVTADVINVTSETPGLDAMLAKFSQEHTHREDEIRFTVKGRGIFHINPKDGPVFGVLVEPGDLINVPAKIQHWFNLCDECEIRCIRLFKDPAGWAPEYVDQPIHDKYTAVCWGPDYLPPADDLEPVVKL